MCECPWRSHKNYRCEFRGGQEIAQITSRDVLVTTWESSGTQQRNSLYTGKSPSQSNASLWNNVGQRNATFVAGIDDYQLLFSHSFFVKEPYMMHWDGSKLWSSRRSGATHGYKFWNARHLRGMLAVSGKGKLQQQLCREHPKASSDHNGMTLTNEAPCFIPPRKRKASDAFKLSELLQSVDEALDDPSFKGSNHTLRFEGLAMVMHIGYRNSAPNPFLGEVFRDEFSYVYQLIAMPTSPYKRTEIHWTEFRKRRDLIQSHGVYIRTVVGGFAKFFDFSTLLITVTTSLTLLAISNWAVQSLATQVLEGHDIFEHVLTNDKNIYEEMDDRQ